MPAATLSRLASIQPSCKTLHETLAHPVVTQLYEYIQRDKVPMSLDEAKRVTAKCKMCAVWIPRFLRPRVNGLIRSSKPWERLSIDIVDPKPMTLSKNQYLLTVVDKFSRFPFAFPLRNITSSSVIKCLLTVFAIFGTPGFIYSDRGTEFVSSEFQNFCRQNGVATSKTTPYHTQGNGQNERNNGIVWKAVQCLLHSTNRPLSDWESVIPSALSSIRTLINTVTMENPHDRFFCFKRGEPLIRPSSSAPWLRIDTPAYLRKFVRAKDQAPVAPIQISEVISPHLAGVSFGVGRIDTVSTSDLSRRPLNIDNEETISQPGGQYKDKETNVDIGISIPDIGTECEPPKSVELVKESQTSPAPWVSPTSTLRCSAKNRKPKPPTYLDDFVLAMN